MPVSRPLRLWLLGALLIAPVLAVFANLSWLGAQAYLRFGADQWAWPDARESAYQAASVAARLETFSAQAHQQQASSSLLMGHDEDALSQYVSALQRAPADAYLWRDYALALIYTGHFDQRLDRAVFQAQTWAPRSSVLNLSLAIAGLKVYDRSDEALRTLWMRSIRYAYWVAPGAVLYAAYLSERELLLCDTVIPQSDHNAWCAAARWRRDCTLTGQQRGCEDSKQP